MDQTPAQRILQADPEEMKDIPVSQLHAALMQHFEDDVKTFGEVMALLKSIDNKLTPIADTYASMTLAGKWAMGGLVTVSMVVGIMYTVWQFLSPIIKRT